MGFAITFILMFLFFSAVVFGVAYYVWVVPEQEAARVLDARLRGVRTNTRTRERGATDLLQRENRGSFAFLGDFFTWIGIVRTLQAYIRQANLTYRAADVVGISIALTLVTYLVLTLFIPIPMLQLALAVLVGSIPIAYIMNKRAGRIAKFEEQLPDAIDLFTRTMRAGHNIHSGLETIA